MYQKKFLIEMKHGLGDCVCMLPAVTAIRKQYPNAYIAMIVNGKTTKKFLDAAKRLSIGFIISA